LGRERVGLVSRPVVGIPRLPGMGMDGPAVGMGRHAVGMARRILDDRRRAPGPTSGPTAQCAPGPSGARTQVRSRKRRETFGDRSAIAAEPFSSAFV
jgi:hypothetical protein